MIQYLILRHVQTSKNGHNSVINLLQPHRVYARNCHLRAFESPPCSQSEGRLDAGMAQWSPNATAPGETEEEGSEEAKVDGRWMEERRGVRVRESER